MMTDGILTNHRQLQARVRISRLFSIGTSKAEAWRKHGLGMLRVRGSDEAEDVGFV